MIEGARLLPWLHEAARSRPKAVEHFTDCDRCMQRNTEQIRQSMGCGYLPPSPDASPWCPDDFERGRPVDGDPRRRELDPTTCIGYTSKLPEVIEVSRARLHWEKGTLRDWCFGAAPTPPLMRVLEEMESQVSSAQVAAIERSRKNGGR